MKILCSIIILVALLSSTLAKPGVYEENSDGEKAYKSALLKYLLRQFNVNERQFVDMDELGVEGGDDIARPQYVVPCYKDSACTIPVLGSDNCCSNYSHYGRLPSGYCCRCTESCRRGR